MEVQEIAENERLENSIQKLVFFKQVTLREKEKIENQINEKQEQIKEITEHYEDEQNHIVCLNSYLKALNEWPALRRKKYEALEKGKRINGTIISIGIVIYLGYILLINPSLLIAILGTPLLAVTGIILSCKSRNKINKEYSKQIQLVNMILKTYRGQKMLERVLAESQKRCEGLIQINNIVVQEYAELQNRKKDYADLICEIEDTLSIFMHQYSALNNETEMSFEGIDLSPEERIEQIHSRIRNYSNS